MTQPTYDGRTSVQLASDAEAALRGIVQLADTDEASFDAETIYGVLSALTRTLAHVPEIISRLRADLEHRHQEGRLAITSGRDSGDPDAAVARLHEAIDSALEHFGPLQTDLQNAQAAISTATDSTD